ncbi:nitrilase-related carbon-nitrogen hydrolase [Streptomyces sp. L7]
MWMDSPAWAIGRGFVQRYFDNSLSYDSPQAERLRDAVRKAKLTAVLGLSEQDGGSLYLAQWLIGPEGESIAKRRKLRPTHAERTVYGEGDGSDLAVHARADIGRIGALCCWEHLQPLSKYVYAQNEQVHVMACELLALRSVRTGARRRGEQRRLARLCGRGLLLRTRALRDSL